MSTSHNSGPDEAQVRRFIVVLLSCFLGAGAAFMALRSGNRMLMALAVGVPLAIPFVSQLPAVYILAAWVGIVGFSMPGMVELKLDLLFHVLLVGICFLQTLMRVPGSEGKGPVVAKRALWGFLAILVALMAVRGSGLRVLGASTWGGATYVFLIVSILFFLVVTPRLKISRRQLKILVWGSLAAGVVAALLERAGFVLAQEEKISRVVRLIWLTPVVMMGLPLILALRLRKSLQYSLLAVCLLLTGLTGFRSRLVALIMVIGLFLFCRSRQKTRFFFISIAAGMLFWMFLILASPYFSPGIQRAVSFVPFVQVDQVVAIDAQTSIEWRLEIWNYGWAKFDQYWLIGRGVAFDVYEFIASIGNALGMGLQSTYFAYLGHVYHSGPVTLLIDYGLPGTVLFLGFMISAGTFMVKQIKRIMYIDSFEARYVLYLCVSLLWQFVAFWLVFGDSLALGRMVMQFSLILVLLPLATHSSTDCDSVMGEWVENSDKGLAKGRSAA